VNNLILIACFVVGLLAIVGLVFVLRETDTSTTKAQETAPNIPATSTPAGAETKTTIQLPDLSTIQAQTDASEQPTTLLTAPVQVETAPLTGAISEDTDQSDEHPDIDELDYTDLPTIRSLSSNHYEGVRAEEERTRVTYEYLQTIANELRALHSQMKNMEQRIKNMEQRINIVPKI